MKLTLLLQSSQAHLAFLLGLAWLLRWPYHKVLIDDFLGRYLYFASLICKRIPLPKGVRVEDLAPGRLLTCILAHFFGRGNPSRVQIFFTLYQMATVMAFYCVVRPILGGWCALAASGAFLFYSNLMVLRTFTLNDGFLMSLPTILAYGLILNFGWESGRWILLAGVFAGWAMLIHCRALWGTVFPLLASFFLFKHPAGAPDFLLGIILPLAAAWFFFLRMDMPVRKLLKGLVKGVNVHGRLLSLIRKDPDAEYPLGTRENWNAQFTLLAAQLFPLLLGIFFLGSALWGSSNPLSAHAFLPLLWLGAGFIGIFVFGPFRASSMSSLVPPLVLASAQGFWPLLLNPAANVIPLGLCAFFFLFALVRQKRIVGQYGKELFEDDGVVEIDSCGSYEISRKCKRLARWIRLRTEPGEQIFFWDGEPAVYYYADRTTPSPIVHRMGSLGSHNYKEYHKILEGLETGLPRFMIMKGYPIDYNEIVKIVVNHYEEVPYVNRRFKIFALKDPHLTGKKMPHTPRLHVVLFVKKRVEEIKQTLHFLYRNTREDFEVTIVQRRKRRAVLEWLRTIRRCTLIRDGKTSVGEIIRKVGERTKGEITAVFSAGQIPPPGWNIMARKHFQEAKDLNILYPLSHHPALPCDVRSSLSEKSVTPSKKEARQIRLLQKHQGKKVKLLEAFSHFAIFRSALFQSAEGKHTFESLVREKGRAALALSIFVDDIRDMKADDAGRAYKKEKLDGRNRWEREKEEMKTRKRRSRYVTDTFFRKLEKRDKTEKEALLAWQLEGVVRIPLQRRKAPSSDMAQNRV